MLTKLILTTTELLLVFLSTVLLFYFFYYQHCYKYWERKGLSTAKTYFPFGNLGWSMVGRESIFSKLDNLYKEFRAKGLKQAGIYFLNGPIYFPLTPDAIKRVLLTDFDHFVDRGTYMSDSYPLTVHTFSMKGNEWRKIRAKTSPAFTSGKMKIIYNIVLKNAENLVENLMNDDGEIVNIKNKFTRFAADVIGSSAFGLDCNSLKNPNNEFMLMVNHMINHSGWNLAKVLFEEGLQNPGNLLKTAFTNRDSEKYFTELIRSTIEYREKNNVVRDDFLNLLLQIRKTNGLTVKEIAAESCLFLLAGFESSSLTMSYCVHELAHNQELQNMLRTEIHEFLGRNTTDYRYDQIMNLPLLDKVVKETLRKYPILPILNRIVVKPYQVPETNVVLDPGTPVLISLLSLHRDPEYFPDPMKFDPERFNNDRTIVPFTYLPFGSGPRNCIGLRFGLMQTKLGLAAILNNFKCLPTVKTPREIVLDKSTTTLVMNVRSGIYTKIIKL